jgi:hypothetical protein
VSGASLSFVLAGILFGATFVYAEELPPAAQGRQSWNGESPLAGPWRWGGALSLNYRNIGARPLEIEIEHQLVLADIFVRAEGPVLKDTPFLLEFALDGDGRPELYRLTVKSLTVRRLELELGRFLVPFGHTNELYRPDLYPLVTKPLLYASPGLDFVSRASYPHPLFSSGYADTGVRISYQPPVRPGWFPRSVTLFLVNGLQESPVKGRSFPDPRNFNVFASVSGTDPDWGHEVNSLADNNDTKNPGGRLSWDYGDITYPSPFSRAALINGFSASVSGMGGKYDIEDQLSHWVWGLDLGLRHREYRLTGDFIYGEVQAKWPALGTAGSDPPTLVKDRYAVYGRTLQLEFPFPEFWLSDQTRVIFRGESMTRHGPRSNVLGEVAPRGGHTRTRMNKYSGGFNSRMNPHFSVKLEYAYWTFDAFSHIWQIAWAGVVTF